MSYRVNIRTFNELYCLNADIKSWYLLLLLSMACQRDHWGKKDLYKHCTQISEHRSLPAATSHTHICKRRHGPSSRWATSRTRNMWGCCTAWTWRCGRCAPPPAEGSRGKVHSEFTCVRPSVFVFRSCVSALWCICILHFQSAKEGCECGC